MVDKVAKKAPKPFKFPKTMGSCADKLFDLREARLQAQKIADELESEEKALKEHIINNLSKDSTGAAGKHHRVQIIPKEVPQAKDWSLIYPYITRHKAFDLLQRRLNEAAIRERLEAGKTIPGVILFPTKSVSLTKI